MIDFAKAEGESRFLKKALTKFGISLNINEAIAALASTIRDHAHLQRLVTETEPSMRQAFYDSVRPHLKFRAKPMDVYIADAKAMAEREQLPVLQPDGTLREFRPASDVATVEKAIAKSISDRNLKLVCSKCTKEETFYCVGDETPVAVILKARKKGWVYGTIAQTETCPECMQARLNA